ncbi:MAG: Gfo/Idh/MocA family oxidoreductase [Proteobacteria bacterium]|jgi:predicted dehydrogenase|nr:Gfo/Idh/MocA family oxidoreductase [Pseudomonadota bacterium]
MSQTLKIAVIGVGHLGKWHADKYAASPDCDLLAVVDNNPKNAEQIAQKHGTRAVSDYHDILSQVDAVSLAVPTSLHYKIARDILEAGIHCLIEKPITETIEEASTLIEIAQKNRLVLQVGHIVRFNSVMMDIGELLQEPQFIESTRLAPFTSRSTDISVILDLMIHDIDIILNLIDSPVKHISASGLSVLSDSIDIANARIEFENECVANVTASRISQKHEQKLRIFQKDMYISADLLKKILSINRKGKTDNEAGFKNITHEERSYGDNDALNLEIQDFIAAIKNGRRPKVNGEDGKRALETAIEITSQIKAAI